MICSCYVLFWKNVKIAEILGQLDVLPVLKAPQRGTGDFKTLSGAQSQDAASSGLEGTLIAMETPTFRAPSDGHLACCALQ